MITFDERAPDFSLQASQRLTERRLRQVKPRGGTAKMQLGCECLHVMQIAKLHIPLLVHVVSTGHHEGYLIGDTVSIKTISS